MADKTIAQTGAGRAIIATDLLEVQATGGGASNHGAVASLLALVPAGPTGATGATGPAGTPGDGQSFLQVTLDAADIAALNTTPFEIVPAPEADEFLVLNRLIATCIHREGASVDGWSMNVGWDGLGGESATNASFNFQTSADSFTAVMGIDPIDGDAPIDIADVLGLSLVLLKTSGTLHVYGAIDDSEVTPAAGGTGWQVGDTFQVDGGAFDPILALGVVDTVDTGAIATFHLTNNVNGYLVGTFGVTATSGVGVDATIDVTSLDYSVNPMTINVSSFYSTIAGS